MIEDKDRTPIAGILVTRCTKCKLELNHTVLFHNNEGIVEKVKCNTCGSEHKYHPANKKAPKKSNVRKPGRKKTDPKKDFELLSQKFKNKEILPYSMSAPFEKDDVIKHKTFGKGIVVEVSSYKMKVLFEDRLRLLVFNR